MRGETVKFTHCKFTKPMKIFYWNLKLNQT